MGTISHHQAKAAEFLQRADLAIATHDPPEAAATLRRAASHAATALAVNAGWNHKSRRQLETALHAAISCDTLSRSHLKTFRQAHTLSAKPPLPLREGAGACPALDAGVKGIQKPPSNPKSKPNHPIDPVHPCKLSLRRLRRRVAALIKAAVALIAGQPKPVRHHKRWQRDLYLPVAPDFTSVQDILRLPNFQDIRQRFGLHHIALSAMPDPHGWYARGDTPRRCQCHAELWNRRRTPTASPSRPHGNTPWKKPSASNSPTPSTSLANVQLPSLHSGESRNLGCGRQKEPPTQSCKSSNPANPDSDDSHPANPSIR